MEVYPNLKAWYPGNTWVMGCCVFRPPAPAAPGCSSARSAGCGPPRCWRSGSSPSRCWCSRSFDRGNAEPLMSLDGAGRRCKCHLRIDQRPRLLHRKPLRIISRASETIRNFICFVARASATIERCKGARPRRDHVRCGVCVNCLRRGRNRDRRVGVVVDAAAAAIAP
jgi:hypothetical protein